jgi:predicted lysophospholipase L1 biosynthesis ABC-type transport system permease subunit
MTPLAALIAAVVLGVIVYLAGLALIWAVVIGLVVFVLIVGYPYLSRGRIP